MAEKQLPHRTRVDDVAYTSAARTVGEEEYSQISKRILDRVAALKEAHPSLRHMTSAEHYEYHVTWVLDDPANPPSKLNGRRAVFEKDGYWFSLQFYRGPWGGAAVFLPIEFGDLKLWFEFGHGGNASVIAAITSILREEHEAFCNKHPWQSPNQNLQATGEPAGAADDSHPATITLRRFLNAVAQSDYATAYALIAQTAKTTGDVTLLDGPLTFERFTGELTIDLKRMKALEAQIAANRKKPRKTSPRQSTHSAAFTLEHEPYELSVLTNKLQRTQKCADYHIGELRVIAAGRVQIPVRTQVVDGIKDNDIAILVKEADAWLLANPLHIIR